LILKNLDSLADLIDQERSALLIRWQQRVRELSSAKQMDVPALFDHIPKVLDELILAFRQKEHVSEPEILAESNLAHGAQRVDDGFDIAEVVSEYNILRKCILELADDHLLDLRGKPLHIINRVIDDCIGKAVHSFAEYQAAEIQRRREEHLAFIAHDLRTPLNAISLAERVLNAQLDAGSLSLEARKMMASLKRNSEYLSSLVARVLDESINVQSETGLRVHRRTFDLWPLIEGLIYDLNPIANANSTRLVNEVPEDLILFADAELVRRIFQNLLANAMQFSPGGMVTIGAHISEVETIRAKITLAGDSIPPDSVGEIDRAPVSNRASERIVRCWVKDTGSGIPKHELESIFEKGTTGSNSPEGTGLGLAIVKSFIEAHDGNIDVQSVEGKGSIFQFILPHRVKSK
jgi:signal transduction histidine kinase